MVHTRHKLYPPATDALQLVRVRAVVRTGAARRIREAAGLTRTEVARSIGTSHACISRWEHGNRVPQGAPAIRYLRLLERLAAATGTDLETELQRDPS
jgi:DNA-binding transcriptional regulator YiaG